MSKRRITHQQTQRIHQKHAKVRAEKTVMNLDEGLVLTCFGKKALVEAHGQEWVCGYRQGIGGLVAGDVVLWKSLPNAAHEGIIETRLPRTTELTRGDKFKQNKTVAANIDHVVVVIAAKPQISWSLLDSYLVMCDRLGLNVTILLNKVDLAESQPLWSQLTEIYQPLDYPLFKLSTQTKAGLEALIHHLKDKTTVFVGQSGVGKSSLIKEIIPHEADIKTQSISTRVELGRHTTSNARLYHLPQGGNLIDSPGVRSFSLWNLNPENIAWGYKEFRPLFDACKFRNCNHIDSPGCAIKAAVLEQKISPHRYENFLMLQKQREEN